MDTKKKQLPTILIVDDQPINIEILSNLLKFNYRILAATSGLKALNIALKENQPDLILLDITMPGLDGYEVCHMLKDNEKTQNIPVIFVTSRTSPEDEEKGFEIGASDYISKPFQPAVIRARIRNQMNLKIRTDALEKMAQIDGLTGIANRRYYNDNSLRIWKQNSRANSTISIVMIDIDNFKAYNDNYGHGVGDDCLISIAQALQNTIKRPMDIFARYGGEEFVAILSNTDSEGTLHIAKNMLNAVRNLKIPHAFSKTEKYVTISIGYATTTNFNIQEPSELQERADRALYLSKDLGRNQIQML